MAVGRGGAEALGEGRPEGLGVLVAETVPGKLVMPSRPVVRIPAIVSRAARLGPTGPRRQACQVDGRWVPGEVADRGGDQVLGQRWEVRISHLITF